MREHLILQGDFHVSADPDVLLTTRNYSPPILRVCVSGEGLVYGHPG